MPLLSILNYHLWSRQYHLCGCKTHNWQKYEFELEHLKSLTSFLIFNETFLVMQNNVLVFSNVK